MAARFKITDEVRDVLRRSTVAECSGSPGDWSLALPDQLDRRLYVEVNKVLEGAGGTWSRKNRKHLFTRDPREILDLAVETGHGVNVQQALQVFYTPPALAARVVELAEFGPLVEAQGNPADRVFEREIRVLEPSIGRGALIQALYEAHDEDRFHVVGYDVDPEAVGHCTEHDLGDEVYLRNFMDAGPAQLTSGEIEACGPEGPGYDRVIMNPPFSKGQDIDHVLHAFEFLRPGGILVAIMSGGVLIGTTKRHKAFYKLRECLGSWDVPAGAFRESGTDVRAVVVKLRRA